MPPSLLGNPAALKLLRGLRLVRLLRLLKLLKLQQHIDTLEDYLEADLGFLQVPLIASDCHLSTPQCTSMTSECARVHLSAPECL